MVRYSLPGVVFQRPLHAFFRVGSLPRLPGLASYLLHKKGSAFYPFRKCVTLHFPTTTLS